IFERGSDWPREANPMSNEPREGPVDSMAEQQSGLDRSAEETAGTGKIGKIREILFGSQMRGYEARFLRLEARLIKERDDIKQEIRNRTAALERLAREEIQALSDRFRTEREERKEAISSAASQINESIRSVERKNTQLDDKTSESHRDLRREIF